MTRSACIHDIPTADRILVNMALDSTNPPIRVVKNWTAGLKK